MDRHWHYLYTRVLSTSFIIISFLGNKTFYILYFYTFVLVYILIAHNVLYIARNDLFNFSRNFRSKRVACSYDLYERRKMRWLDLIYYTSTLKKIYEGGSKFLFDDETVNTSCWFFINLKLEIKTLPSDIIFI